MQKNWITRLFIWNFRLVLNIVCFLLGNSPASIIERKNIINFIRAQRLSWLGHIETMQGTRMVKAIYS